MPEDYAMPFALDRAGFAGAGPYHRVRSRGEREIANGSRARSVVTPDRTETNGFLRFVQQPIRRLSDDRICGHEILARPFGRADSAAREAWFAEIEGDREVTTVDIAALAAAEKPVVYAGGGIALVIAGLGLVVYGLVSGLLSAMGMGGMM